MREYCWFSRIFLTYPQMTVNTYILFLFEKSSIILKQSITKHIIFRYLLQYSYK